MSSPQISIIVPVYNAERYLHRSIDSILGQTFTDFELLLIDDGSKDSSGEICDAYAAKDARVRVFHKPNGGASSARNVGLEEAKGEWVTFCDSDDYVLQGWLENFVHNDDLVDVVVQGLETDAPLWQEADKRFMEQRKFSLSYKGDVSEGTSLLSQHKILGYLVNKCFKRDIIRNANLRFDERLYYMEDEEFTLRYLCHCRRMVAVEEIGYYYFVPRWDAKYSDRRTYFELFGSLYLSARHIYEGRSNPLTEYYLDMYIRELLDAYRQRSKERIWKLRRLRKNVGKDVLKSRLFFLTKWMVYLDASLLVAHVVLGLHARLRP